MEEMTPVIDTGVCTGCGRCVEICPSVFQVRDGKSTVINYDCKGCDCDQLTRACHAIKVYEDF